MRVAVLLTGQLRTVDMVKYLHLNALIKPYDSDVFLGIDLNNKHQCVYENSTKKNTIEEANKVIDFFKPVNSFILDEFDAFKEQWCYLLFRQYFCCKKTYEMLKRYSERNNIEYDLIIRLRFDQLIFSHEVPIEPKLWNNEIKIVSYNKDNIDILHEYSKHKKFIFEEINDNTIYVFGFGNFEHYKYANDQFFYHNHSLLEKMMNFYDHIFTIMEYCIKEDIGTKGALIECIFYLYIKQFNDIILKKSNIYGIFIREKI